MTEREGVGGREAVPTTPSTPPLQGLKLLNQLDFPTDEPEKEYM